MKNASNVLALFGGTPVCAGSWPPWPVFDDTERRLLSGVLESGKWWFGERVRQFESEFAAFQGSRYAVTCTNGTTAIEMGLKALGVLPGDEVIVPPYSFVATASAVVTVGAIPVFADIRPDTLCLDPADVARKITPRTRAIIPVHFGGLPADMDAIMAIAKRHNLCVIEDAAHAHGAEYKGRRVGSIGDMGSFSFQSSKNLTSGEGGFITANDADLAARCRSIHNCGRRPGHAWYEHFVISGNFRLSEFQGAILNAQLQRLDEQVRRRETNGKYLMTKLGSIPGLGLQSYTADCTRHAFHLFSFRIDSDAFGAPRPAVLKALEAEGIPNFCGYPDPLYKQPLFLDREFGPFAGCTGIDYAATRCPNCEAICYQQGGWLEQRILLGTQADMDDIVRAFTKVHEHRAALADWARSQ